MCNDAESLKSAIPQIQTYTTSGSFATESWTQIKVTWDNTFSGTPMIFATIRGSIKDATIVVYSKTTTGGTLMVYNSSSSSTISATIDVVGIYAPGIEYLIS